MPGPTRTNEPQQANRSSDSRRLAPAPQKRTYAVAAPETIIQRARIAPGTLTHADVMQLQKTIGNRAVGRLFKESGLDREQESTTVAQYAINKAGNSDVSNASSWGEHDETSGKADENVIMVENDNASVLGKYSPEVEWSGDSIVMNKVISDVFFSQSLLNEIIGRDSDASIEFGKNDSAPSKQEILVSAISSGNGLLLKNNHIEISGNESVTKNILRSSKSFDMLGDKLGTILPFKGYRSFVDDITVVVEGKINPWVQVVKGKIRKIDKKTPRGQKPRGEGWQWRDPQYGEPTIGSAAFEDDDKAFEIGREVSITTKEGKKYTGVVEETTMTSRSGRSPLYKVKWDGPVPSDLRRPFKSEELTPGEFRERARTTKPPKVVTPEFTEHQREMQKLFIESQADLPSEDEEWVGEKEVEMELMDEEQSDKMRVASEEGFAGSFPVSSLLELFKNRPELFFLLLKYSDKVVASDIAPMTSHRYTEPEKNSGEIVCHETFAALFWQRGSSVEVIVRTADGEVKPVVLESAGVRHNLDDFIYRNSSFPKKDADAIERLRNTGIDILRKQVRIEQTGNYDYHAEEKLVDSEAFNWVTHQLFDSLMKLSGPENKFENITTQELEGLKTRIIVAINRTSCDDCANVLSQRLNEFWDKLKKNCPSLIYEYILKNRIFDFELSSPYLYSKTTKKGIEQLMKAGWNMTVHQVYGGLNLPEYTQSQHDLGYAIMRIRDELVGQSDLSMLESRDESEGSFGEFEDLEDEDLKESTDDEKPGRESRQKPIREESIVLNLQRDISYVLKGVYLPEYFRDWNVEVKSFENRCSMELNSIYWSLVAIRRDDLSEEEILTNGNKMIMQYINEFTAAVKKLLIQRGEWLEKNPMAINTQKGEEFTDGNCLFNSVRSSGGIDVESNKLRLMVAREIRDNPMNYLPYLTFEESDNVMEVINKAADYLAGPGNWAANYGDLAPVALAYALNRTICILNMNGTIRALVGPAWSEPIFIYYNGFNHYISATSH